MTKFNDQQIDFKQGGDDGQNNAESIQPINNAEDVVDTVLDRPLENLRKRSEVLKKIIEDLLFYADYDRQFVLRSNAVFSLTEPSAGNFELTMAGDNLTVFPALTPGFTSGGRDFGAKMFTQQGLNFVPYAGTLGVNDLSLVANSQYTGQRGYYDGNNFSTDVNALSLGANRLTVSFIADPLTVGGVGTIQAVVSQDPATHVTLIYGTLTTPTTIADVISFINGDTASQGTYGLSHLFRASTTSLGTSAPPVITNAIFQGGYDAEAHTVTIAQLAAFFAADSNANRLKDGESLAVGYGIGLVESGPVVPKGGRRQSIYDLPTSRTGTTVDNTSAAVGYNLFNTGREPEKIAGAISIGKMVNGEFVFIDGTRLPVGASIQLTESPALLTRLANQLAGTAGANLIGYSGSGPFDIDAAASAVPNLPASSVQAALSLLVSVLANRTVGQSGALHIGSEAITGSATAGNTAFSLLQKSIRGQLQVLLNQANGLNRRVLETGHVLKGPNPITRFFDDVTSTGNQRFSSILSSYANGEGVRPGIVPNYADLILEPIVIPGANISVGMPLAAPPTLTADNLQLNISAPNFATVWLRFPKFITYPGLAPALDLDLSPLIFASISGAVGGTDGDGFYAFYGFVGALADQEFKLVKLNGGVPDFSTTNLATATVTFYSGFHTGQNSSLNKLSIFNISDKYPSIVVGAPSPQDHPWLETYSHGFPALPANYNDPAEKGSIFYVKKAIFDVTGTNRDTDNILITADKSVLAGNESGTPIDATTSHHHANNYTKFILANNQTLLSTTVGALATTTPLTQVTVTATPTLNSYTVTVKSVKVRVTIFLNATPFAPAPIVSTSQLSLNFYATDALANIKNQIQIDKQQYFHTGITNMFDKLVYEITVPALGGVFFVQNALQTLVNSSTAVTINLVGWNVDFGGGDGQ